MGSFVILRQYRPLQIFVPVTRTTGTDPVQVTQKKAVTDPVHTRTTTATDHVKGTGAAVTDTVKGIEVAVVDMVHATIAAVNRPSSYYNSRW